MKPGPAPSICATDLCEVKGSAYLAQPSGRGHIALQPVERALVVFQVSAGVVAAAAICMWNVKRLRALFIVGAEEGLDRVGHGASRSIGAPGVFARVSSSRSIVVAQGRGRVVYGIWAATYARELVDAMVGETDVGSGGWGPHTNKRRLRHGTWCCAVTTAGSRGRLAWPTFNMKSIPPVHFNKGQHQPRWTSFWA